MFIVTPTNASRTNLPLTGTGMLEIAGHSDARPLSSQDARERAAALLRQPARAALFLDLDGTLIPIAPTPHLARAPEDLSAVIHQLCQKLDGALAIITGRPIAEADALLFPLNMVIAGVHGAEMRREQKGEIMVRAASFDAELFEEITRLTQSIPGMLVEFKGQGVAIHYRLASSHDQLLEHLNQLVARRYQNMRVLKGRRVVEILPAGISKAAALSELSLLPQFQSRVPIVIGDDIADGEAFDAAATLGGIGLKVAGEYFSTDEAAFQDPASVLRWLKSMASS